MVFGWAPWREGQAGATGHHFWLVMRASTHYRALWQGEARAGLDGHFSRIPMFFMRASTRCPEPSESTQQWNYSEQSRPSSPDSSGWAERSALGTHDSGGGGVGTDQRAHHVDRTQATPGEGVPGWAGRSVPPVGTVARNMYGPWVLDGEAVRRVEVEPSAATDRSAGRTGPTLGTAAAIS